MTSAFKLKIADNFRRSPHPNPPPRRGEGVKKLI